MAKDRDPFEVWQKSVRRALRDVVRERGQVPSLFGAFSAAANPRKLDALPRLDLLPDGATIREHLTLHARRYLSRFGAIAQLKDPDDGRPVHVLLVTCFTIDQTALWQAVVDRRGIGAWEPGDFRHGDIESVRAVLIENAKVAL